MPVGLDLPSAWLGRGPLACSLLPLAASASPFDGAVPWAGVYDLWLGHVQATFFVAGGTALSGSHQWVGTLTKNPAGTLVATITINSGASGAWRTSGQTAIGALVGLTNFQLGWTWTKTGTPGDLSVMPNLTYRPVVT